MADAPVDLLPDMAAVVLAIQKTDPSLHEHFLRILQHHRDVLEAARRVVRSRHSDLDTGSINWVAVLDCHLQRLGELIGEREPVEAPELGLRDGWIPREAAAVINEAWALVTRPWGDGEHPAPALRDAFARAIAAGSFTPREART